MDKIKRMLSLLFIEARLLKNINEILKHNISLHSLI